MTTGPGQELIDLAVGMAVDDPDEDVIEIGERIDLVQLAGFDQGGNDSPVLGTAVRAREQCVFTGKLDRTD
jgi:hypothetical protein